MANKYISRLFDLHKDKADDDTIYERINNGTEFAGSNLWTLIFAIFIASIGLNVNSTAVIIGAMLISPLMGPIVGIGYSLGTYDIPLLKKAAKNLAIAVVISILTSSLYFTITPLHEAQSELLARTNPTTWDVFIAFFGGLAGIVGSSRKEISNTVPGVAIATALMPPLCTAGYGISIGNWMYFGGAIYLFCINSVFICLSALLIIRFLKFKHLKIENPDLERKVRRYISIIVIITVLPSIYLAYKMVNKTIFENNAKRFVENECNFNNAHLIKSSFYYRNGNPGIELLVIGDGVDSTTIKTLKEKLQSYSLASTKLTIEQSLTQAAKIDEGLLKNQLLNELLKQQSEKEKGNNIGDVEHIVSEVKTLFPVVSTIAIAETPVYTISDSVKAVNYNMAIVSFSKEPPSAEKAKLKEWLQKRMNKDSITLITSSNK